MALLDAIKSIIPGASSDPKTAPVSSARPAPARPDEESRPHTLWRALCFAVEPMLIDRPVPSQSAAWGIPRGLLASFQQRLASGMTGWSTHLRAYSAAATPEEKLLAVKTAMAEAGLFVARAPGFTDGPAPEQATAAMKLFGRMLMAGPMFIDAALETLKVDPAALEGMPFVRTRERPAVTLDAVSALALAAAAEAKAQALSGFRLAPLVLVQATMLIRPASGVLLAVPPELLGDPEALLATPRGQLLDFMLWDLDRLVDDCAQRAPRLSEAIADGRLGAVIELAAAVERIQASTSGLSDVVLAPPSDLLTGRMLSARQTVCRLLASDAAPCCARALEAAATDPRQWDDPTAARGLRAAAFLLRSAAKASRDPDSRAAASAALARGRAALGTAVRHTDSRQLRDAVGILGLPPSPSA